jgi:hypothetical protein
LGDVSPELPKAGFFVGKGKVDCITAGRARELLSYNAETGVLTWKVSRGGVRAGDPAGSPQSKGYEQVRIDGTLYYTHRVAWLIAHGRWPIDQLDHVNGLRTDNRLKNLRECTQAQNNQNRASTAGSTSAHVGVCWMSRREKWQASIRAGGKNKTIGLFDSEEDASSAYRKEKEQLHKFNPVPRGRKT